MYAPYILLKDHPKLAMAGAGSRQEQASRFRHCYCTVLLLLPCFLWTSFKDLVQVMFHVVNVIPNEIFERHWFASVHCLKRNLIEIVFRSLELKHTRGNVRHKA